MRTVRGMMFGCGLMWWAIGAGLVGSGGAVAPAAEAGAGPTLRPGRKVWHHGQFVDRPAVGRENLNRCSDSP